MTAASWQWNFCQIKHGNWYLVKGDKNLLGSLQTGRFSLVVGEEMKKFLAGATLLLIPSPSRGEPCHFVSIWILMIPSTDIFNLDILIWRGTIVNFTKRCPMPICPKVTQRCILQFYFNNFFFKYFGLKLQHISYNLRYSKDFFETRNITGHYR